jgi:uracil-DNA glycosylase family 4
VVNAPAACEPCAKLEALWARYSVDPELSGLRRRASQMVPGVGRADRPPVAFVGEAPGKDEDAAGRPFVGRAGQVLFDTVSAELGFTRNDVWTTNVVKYRPTGNRTPNYAELLIGRRYLREELSIVRPRWIVTLGGSALRLIRNEPVTRVHGQPFMRGRWQYMPMLHPSYVLRKLDAVRPSDDDRTIDIWHSDFRQLRRLLDSEAHPVVR